MPLMSAKEYKQKKGSPSSSNDSPKGLISAKDYAEQKKQKAFENVQGIPYPEQYHEPAPDFAQQHNLTSPVQMTGSLFKNAQKLPVKPQTQSEQLAEGNWLERNVAKPILDFNNMVADSPVGRLAFAAAESVTPETDLNGNPGIKGKMQEWKPQGSSNETVNNILDFAGHSAGYFMNPAGGGGPVALYKGLGNILTTKAGAKVEEALFKGGQKAADKLNPLLNTQGVNLSRNLAGKMLQEGAKEGLTGAAYAVPNSMLQGQNNAGQIGKNMLEQGLMGVAAGPILSAAGHGLGAATKGLRDRQALKGVLKDFATKPDTVGEKALYNAGAGPVRDMQLPRSGSAPGDELAANFRKGEAYQQEYIKAVGDQYDYLKHSMQDRGGVTQGGLIKDSITGEVTDRFGRTSNNPVWYQDFYKQNGRKPTDKDLRALAEQHVKEGFQTEGGRVPAWKPQELQDINDELSGISGMMPRADQTTRAELQTAASTLQGEKSKLGKMLPEGVQALRNHPIPLRDANPNAIIKKPITRQQLLDNARKRLGVTVRTGRVGIKDDSVLGIYKVNPEVVRSRQHGDIQVISHEVGHHLDNKLGLADPRYDQELMSLGQHTSASNYAPNQVRQEGIAEYIRLYLTDPETAQQAAPRFSQFFDGKLPKDVRKALAETQKDVATWIDQGPAMQLRGQINRTGKDASKSVADRVDEVYTSFVDKLHPLSVVEKTANLIQTGVSKLSDASQSLYKKARLYAGTPKKAQLILKDFKAILKPLDKFGYKMKDLGDYAAAKHALELENQGIESGFNMTQIQDTIRKFGSPEMLAIHRRLVMYNNNLLDMLVKGQVLSQEAVDAMRKKYPDYVPFYRHFDEDMKSGFGGKGFADLTNPVKRLKGSTRDVIDPLQNMVKNTFAVVNAVERNKVGLELSNLADVPGMGSYVERLSGNAQAPNENIVTVFQNGERVQYQLDPELYRAMKQMDEDVSNKLVKFLSIPSSTLRAGATLTPEFMLRNPIRDQFQTYVTSNFGYKPIIDLPMGLFHVLGRTNTYKQWVSEGGGYGNYISQDRNYLREQLKQLKDERNPWAKATVAIVNPKQWLRLLQTMSEISEEATKVGEFRRGIKKGFSPEEAAFQSRDLMDFARVGNNIKQVNQVVTFLNANLQGKDRLARAFKNNPMRTTVRAITAVTMPTIGFYMWNQSQANEKQKETLKNAPQWLRDTFFLVAVPGTDVVARIPKPFDLAPVFANLPENIMRWMDGNEPQSTGDFAKGAAIDMLKVPYMLTGLTPLIENATNHSFFTNGPIVPQRDQDLLPEDQYGVTTSLTARTIGKTLGVSPYKVDNLIRGYGAGLGKYATSGSDAILGATGAGKLPPAEEKKISELPVINAFTVDSTGGGKTMDDFYKKLDELSRIEQSNAKNKVIDDKAKVASDLLQTASRDIGKLRTQYRDVQGSFTLTPVEKRKQLDALDMQMNNKAREALGVINAEKR